MTSTEMKYQTTFIYNIQDEIVYSKTDPVNMEYYLFIQKPKNDLVNARGKKHKAEVMSRVVQRKMIAAYAAFVALDFCDTSDDKLIQDAFLKFNSLHREYMKCMENLHIARVNVDDAESRLTIINYEWPW